MLKKTLSVFLVLTLCMAMIGVAMAADGTIVKVAKGKLTVKIGDKEEVIPMKGVKFVNAGGQKLKKKQLKQLLIEGAKVEVTKEGDKVVEVKVK